MVKRTWREAGKEINRKVNINEVTNIEKALENGWVVTFPQGTTTAFAPGRRGTALIVRKSKPIVVPVVIDGFRRAFDKKGLKLKKLGVKATMKFKDPIDIDYENDSNEEIMKKIMDAIEQSPEFLKVKSIEEIVQDRELHDFFD